MSQLCLLAASMLAKSKLPPPVAPPTETGDRRAATQPETYQTELERLAQEKVMAACQSRPSSPETLVASAKSSQLKANSDKGGTASDLPEESEGLFWTRSNLNQYGLGDGLPGKLTPKSSPSRVGRRAFAGKSILVRSGSSYRAIAKISPEMNGILTEFSQPSGPRPVSGSQFYAQRVAALQAGSLQMRSPSDRFYPVWSEASGQPTYEQWKSLLVREARAIGRGQGDNRLGVLLGDSLTLWLPTTRLPSGQFWLNQGISGDTTAGILKRLNALQATRPNTIYLMAGINDLRRGWSDQTILNNFEQIIRRLRQNHPQAQLVVQSILPTRASLIPCDRIQRLNERIQAIAENYHATYLDLYPTFADDAGHLRPDLTTDGLHLNSRGYQVWQWVLKEFNNPLPAQA